jgi:DNA mismatch endonuclease (patch repair protein)
MDVFTPAQRSEIMSRIRSVGTVPEERLAELARVVLGGRRKLLRNAATVEGTPDIVVPSLRLCLFADGCFFHGCPSHCRMPSTNQEYWRQKIQRNQRRDRRVNRALRRQGYSVWRFWEHELKPAGVEAAAKRLRRALHRSVERAAEGAAQR